jgi:hypothetical protein
MTKQNQSGEERKFWIPMVAKVYRDAGFLMSEYSHLDGPENYAVGYQLNLKCLPDLSLGRNPNRDLHYIALERQVNEENLLEADTSDFLVRSLQERILVNTPYGLILHVQFDKEGKLEELGGPEELFEETPIVHCPRELIRYVGKDSFDADQFLKDLFDYAIRYKK